MAQNRRLLTDRDFQEAVEREFPIRVFRDAHIVDSNGVISRFDDRQIVVQSGVSDIAYYPREQCEFFEMKKR
jgi:hypothetical protein